jgi:hypothetical protein
MKYNCIILLSYEIDNKKYEYYNFGDLLFVSGFKVNLNRLIKYVYICKCMHLIIHNILFFFQK